MFVADFYLNVYDIANGKRVSQEGVNYFKYKELGTRKLTGIWVPHLSSTFRSESENKLSARFGGF